MADTSLLRPKVNHLAQELKQECKRAGSDFIFTQTFRTDEEQDNLYAQGRTKSGKIVTNARGGYSFHNYGVAFDICPVVNGKLDWNNVELLETIGKIGMSLGLEWGGSWKEFPDLPHFQYTAGYTINDFRNSKIDWKKFEVDQQDSFRISKRKTRLSGF